MGLTRQLFAIGFRARGNNEESRENPDTEGDRQFYVLFVAVGFPVSRAIGWARFQGIEGL